jgi:hypothetical protein
MYCIDRHTDTTSGIPYDPGTWSATNVPNLGYVLRILHSFYPATNEPAAASSDSQRAAAVQAAIWFFTDRFVLAPGDARFALTSGIVTAAVAAGPLPEPPPSLTITGPATATVDTVTGPFHVQGNAATATLTASGATLYSDEAATEPIPDGAVYPVGKPLWLRSNTPGSASIQARASATNPTGRALLYAPEDPADPQPPTAPASDQRCVGNPRDHRRGDRHGRTPGADPHRHGHGHGHRHRHRHPDARTDPHTLEAVSAPDRKRHPAMAARGRGHADRRRSATGPRHPDLPPSSLAAPPTLGRRSAPPACATER